MRSTPFSKFVIRTFAGLSVLASGQALAQSAWTRPAGETLLQFSIERIGPYDEVFQDHGPDFVPGREITQTALATYAEYGLKDDLTLIGSLAIQFLDTGSLNANATIPVPTITSESETKLGNLVLGLRQQLADDDYALAAQLAFELPTGSLDRSSGLSSGLDAFTFLPTLSVGRGFGKSYAQAYLGAGLRTNDYSSDWRLGAEYGYRFDKLQLAFNVDLVETLLAGSENSGASNEQTALYVDQQEYLAFGFKGSYPLSPGVDLQAAARFAASGKNVAKSPFISIGISLHW